MKRYLSYFVFLFCFLLVSNVYARSDIIATCNYGYNNNIINTGFEIKIHRDRSLSYSTPDGTTVALNNSSSNVYTYKYYNFENYLKTIYFNDKLDTKCPILYGGIDTNHKYIRIYHKLDNNKTLEKWLKETNDGITAKMQLTGTLNVLDKDIEQEKRGEKHFCVMNKRVDGTKVQAISIDFFENEIGEKMFAIYPYKEENKGDYRDAEGAVTGTRNQTVEIELGAHTFQFQLDFNDENIAGFYSDKCSETPIYLKSDYRGSYYNVITSEPTDPAHNGAGFGQEDTGEQYNPIHDVNPGDGPQLSLGDTNCDAIFGNSFGILLKKLLSLIRYAVPILIIGLSVIDFIKTAATQSQEEIKKAVNKLIKRVIIGAVIFLLPTIIDVLLKLAGVESGTCGIG